MLKFKGIIIVIALMFFAFTGCSKEYVDMDMFVYSNPELNTVNLHSFKIIASEVVDQNLEIPISAILKDELGSKGYIYDDQSPDFIIEINSGSSETTEKILVVNTTHKASEHKDIRYTLSRTPSNYYWNPETYTPKGPLFKAVEETATVEIRNIELTFYFASGEVLRNSDIFWSGEAVVKDGGTDLVVVAPKIVAGLVDVFTEDVKK